MKFYGLRHKVTKEFVGVLAEPILCPKGMIMTITYEFIKWTKKRDKNILLWLVANKDIAKRALIRGSNYYDANYFAPQHGWIEDRVKEFEIFTIKINPKTGRAVR